MAFLFITRPMDESVEMEKKIDLPVIKAPLLEIEVLPPSLSERENSYSGLIVTSGRALDLFPNLSSFRKKAIWCVGEKTAQKAKSLGCETIYSADNSAENLYQLILSKTQPKKERFLHICGEHLHFDIVEKLKEQGYLADKEILYRMQAVTQLSTEVVAAFKKHQITLAPVYSRRTAEVFAHLIEKHHLENHLKTITLVVYASHIAEPLQRYQWRQIIIQPHLSVEVLQKLYHKIEAKEAVSLSVKKLYLGAAATLLMSIGVSLLSLFIVGPRLFSSSMHTSKTYQETITRLKSQYDSLLSDMQKQLKDINTQTETLKKQLQNQMSQLDKEIKAIKQFPPSLPSLAAPTTDAAFQAFTLLNILEGDLLQGQPLLPLWQEIQKLLKKLSIPLPQTMEGTEGLPPSRQSIIQAVKKISFTPISEEEKGVPLTHHWLEKIEKYIGRIVIKQGSSSLKTVEGQESQLINQVIQAIEQDNLPELNAWKARKDIPSSLFPLLDQACQRKVFIEGIQELKKAVVSLLNQEKE